MSAQETDSGLVGVPDGSHPGPVSEWTPDYEPGLR